MNTEDVRISEFTNKCERLEVRLARNLAKSRDYLPEMTEVIGGIHGGEKRVHNTL
jgi:hypothetical protein